MSVAILVVVAVLLIWVFLTRERYTDLALPDRDVDRSDREVQERARRVEVHLAEAEFWEQRSAETVSDGARSVATNMAVFHRQRAAELDS